MGMFSETTQSVDFRLGQTNFHFPFVAKKWKSAFSLTPVFPLRFEREKQKTDRGTEKEMDRHKKGREGERERRERKKQRKRETKKESKRDTKKERVRDRERDRYKIELCREERV